MKEPISGMHLLEQLAAQVDAAELYEVRSFELPVRFNAGALESIRSVETAGRALRVIHQGRLGFSTTTDLTDGNTLSQNALAAAQFSDPVVFEFPDQPAPSTVPCFDPQVEGLDERQLIALGEEVAGRIQAYDPELQVEASVNKQIEEVRLLNTKGLVLEDRRSSLSLSLEVTQTREDDIWIVGRSVSSRQRGDIDGPALAEYVVERLRWGAKTVSIPSRPMPVVFNLGGALVPLMPLLWGLNGRYVYLNTSPLSEKLGQPAFDEQLTLVDDGRLDFGVRSASFDDEGVPTSTRRLIEAGRVRQFLYDLKTAAQAGTQPTGNGFKSGLFRGGYKQRPDVAPANWLVTPGEQSLEQILQGLDEALLVEDVLGLGQGNIIAGEFSNNVFSGFLVRRGEILGRVKNTMIAGNAYELLKENLLALSDRPQWVFGVVNTPAIAIDGVGVASKG
jgi:PmbA protein